MIFEFASTSTIVMPLVAVFMCVYVVQHTTLPLILCLLPLRYLGLKTLISHSLMKINPLIIKY